MAFIPAIEQQTIQEQEVLQLEKLHELLQYIAIHSPYYKSLFAKHTIEIDEIKSIRDLQKIPTTSKEDIQTNNFDFLCVPPAAIAEYTATSGTMGHPVTIALTKKDIERLAYNEYLSFELMELKEEDTLQFMLTLDRQFMAGMAYYLGLQKIGAASIRTGPGLPSMQLDCATRLHSSAIVSVPSFIIKLIEYAHLTHFDLNQLPIKKALCIGENLRTKEFELNALGKYIRSKWNLKLYATYASTEMQTAFTECEHGIGGHAHPELIIIEILDDDGNQLQAEEFGEVTVTTLGVEGMPLLRYRTGDICCYHNTPCACGRNTIRLSPIVGRKKQMIKYKGTTLYPPAIFEVLNQCDFIKEYVVEVTQTNLATDELILHIYTMLNADTCEQKLKPFLQSQLRVIPTLKYVSSSEIHQMQFPEGSRKTVKFIDKRNQHT